MNQHEHREHRACGDDGCVLDPDDEPEPEQGSDTGDLDLDAEISERFTQGAQNMTR